MLAFQEKLDALGHFYTKYDNPEHLKRQFRDQLDKLFPYSVSSPAAGGGRIPRELPPAANQYFGRRDEVKKLASRLLTHRETAVIGIAGMGKTALAAEALGHLPPTCFPDGIVYLDLYTLRASAEQAWDALANKLGGPDFLEQRPAKERAEAACQSRNILVIIEGGEEAIGKDGRTSIPELFSVLSPQNHRLLLTRLKIQSNPADSIELREALEPDDAAALFDSLTVGRVKEEVRTDVLELLQGHLLALTWAGNLLARDDEDARLLISDWKSDAALSLNDPTRREHTLRWLMERSVRGLDDLAQRTLQAAALLAHAPFPVGAIAAGIGAEEMQTRRALKALVEATLLRRVGEENWQFTHILAYSFARREKDSDPTMREGLGKWLHGKLAKLLQDAADPGVVARGLEHLGALLKTDFDQQLWRPLANGAMYDFSDRLTTIGRLGQVRLALDAVERWFEVFAEQKREENQWRRERTELMNRQGDAMLSQGNLAGAKELFLESLEERQNHLNDPQNFVWQRDLSVSHNKVGGVRLAQGDLEGASQAFQNSLSIRRHLAEIDPSNTQWQVDLSVGHDRVSGAREAQGNLAGALQAAQNSLDIRRRLAQEDPSSTEWQRNLSVSYDYVGNVRKAQGDLAGALQAFQQSLDVLRRLAQTDPSNAEWLRDLSWTLHTMATIHEAENRVPDAIRLAEESLAINERLAALDPTNVMWQGDLKFTRNLVDRLRRNRGKGATSRKPP